MVERPSIRRSFEDGAPAGARSFVVALANVDSYPRSSAISVAGSTDGKSFLEKVAEIPDTFRAATSFEQDVVREMQQNNPEVLSWLRSVSGAAFQLGVICLYILIDTSNGLILSAAMRSGGKPIGAVMIGMNSFISVLIGLGLVVITGQMDGGAGAAQAIKNAFNAKQIMAFSGVAFLFTLASIFNVMCYQYIDASVAKILSQLRLPLTALIGTVIVGKKYSMNQWMAIVILTASAYSFFELDQHHNTVNRQRKACFYPREFYEPLSLEESSTFKNCEDTNHGVPAPWKAAPSTDSDSNPMLGVIFMLIAVLLNVVASLFCERLMKASRKTPIYVQKLQLELTGLPVAIISSFVIPLMPLLLSGAYWSELPTALPLVGETLAGKVRGPNVEAAEAKMFQQAVKQLKLAGPKAMIWWKHQGDVNLTYSLTTRVNGTDQTLTGQSEVLSVGGKGPFMNWTELVIVALILDILVAWMGGIITKRFSTVVRFVCKALVLICTVIGSEILKDPAAGSLPLQMYTVALVIFCDTILFSSMKDDKLPDAHGATTEAAPGAREIQLAESPISSVRA